MNRPSWLPALALLAGCPQDDTDTWPDPDPGSDTEVDTEVDTDTDVTGFTAHCGEVVEDEVWRASGNPHLLGCDVEIIEGVVSIEPGVEVFALGEAQILISEAGLRASLRAMGTAADPIVFQPEETDDPEQRWGGIVIYPDADGVTFEHTRIERTGAGFTGNGLTVINNTIAVDTLTIDDTVGVGLNLFGDARLTEDSTALVVQNATTYPVSVAASWAHTLPSIDSSYTGNGELGPEIRGELIEESVTWEDIGTPYLIDGSVQVAAYIDRPAVLTLDEGAVLLFSVGDALSLAQTGGEAGLLTLGTADNPVTLSSRGADTGGFWRGIVANRGTSTLDLTHTIVAFGGRGLTTLSAIDVNDTEVRVDNLTIRQSERLGIALTGSSSFTEDSSNLTITGCTFPGLAPSMTISTLPDGEFTGNTVDAFQVRGNINWPTQWPKLDVPYWVANPIFVDGYADVPAVLTIDAGTDVWFANNTRLEFSAAGGAAALVAQGTVSEPITFTAAQFAENGAWDGLWFRDMCEDDDIVMDHFLIEYAGGGLIAPYNLLFDSCDPANVTNGTVRFSANVGLGLLQGATPASMSNISFFGNFVDQECTPLPCAP